LEPLPARDRIGYHEIMRVGLAPSFLTLAEVAMSFEQTNWYQSLVANWRAEGREEGRQEGRAEGESRGVTAGRKSELLRVISRQLGRRLALPGPAALAQMEALSIETLEDLAEDLLDFTAPSDLDAWLARRG
ncbi:MAG: DUF4351 domain-containing protein, partial [Candidatus Sericytochromatia bacterium]|nr:DUF4351 domain-containing protein [Candidatus Sericytochromatia bacterium]